jgi:hypothetical protein
MSETQRVTMLWPSELKEQVRDKAGQRGMTVFTVEAVRARLTVTDDLEQAKKELAKTQYLAQLLADRVAMGGDAQDRREAMMEVELPSWIQTDGWPKEIADLVKPEPAPEPVKPVVTIVPPKEAPVAKPEPDERPEPAVETPVETPALPHGGHSAKGDLMERVRAKQKELGLVSDEDMRESLGLMKPASELKKPVPKPAIPTEPAPELGVPADAPTPVAPAPEPVVDRCPSCGEPLVAGECWECF